MATRRRPTKLQPDPPVLPRRFEAGPPVLESGDLLECVRIEGGLATDDRVVGAELRESACVDVDLSGSVLGGFACRDVVFEHCDLSGAVLDSASLQRVSFAGCRLTGLVLSGSTLRDVRISDSRADLANLRMVRASYLRVERTSLHEAEFYRAALERSALLECDLGAANFTDASLTEVDLHGCDVDGLRGAMSLAGARIGPDQAVPLGFALLAAAGIAVTDEPRQ